MIDSTNLHEKVVPQYTTFLSKVFVIRMKLKNGRKYVTFLNIFKCTCWHHTMNWKKNVLTGVSIWTHEKVLLLIELYREHRELFSNSAIKRHEVWRKIASQIQAKGHHVTGDMCDKKFRSLRNRCVVTWYLFFNTFLYLYILHACLFIANCTL